VAELVIGLSHGRFVPVFTAALSQHPTTGLCLNPERQLPVKGKADGVHVVWMGLYPLTGYGLKVEPFDGAVGN
jgi:hypothetical protein